MNAKHSGRYVHPSIRSAQQWFQTRAHALRIIGIEKETKVKSEKAEVKRQKGLSIDQSIGFLGECADCVSA